VAEPEPVLDVRELVIYYRMGVTGSRLRRVAGPLSFQVRAGEFVGLAGPSGCGKSSVGKAVLNLIPNWTGTVCWCGRNIRRSDLRPWRKHFGWIGQEPTLLFNPRRRIGQVLQETLRVHGASGDASSRIAGMCETMNLEPSLVHRYPFELSAGQIQRFALIRTFLLNPKFVVLDEPTSSLDPITQLQIFEFIEQWRTSRQLAALLISHSRVLLERVCASVVEWRGTPE